MGHIEGDETAVGCAWRELQEEVGLAKGDAALLGMWALEQVHPYFLAGKDEIVLSPRFAAEVRGDWGPRLNEEHTDARWVRGGDGERMFMWPGQRAVIAEILGWLLRDGELGAEKTRIV
jgi:8-oxo-dGTP pyrophosphatase MutT (NUDIX family)